ncbi:MAG: amidoligase family protein [Myxococcota bacterium]
MGALGWRVGVELELMAPPTRTRRDLAEALAGPGGRVERFFHPQSEPSLVENMDVFDSLTLGFRALDREGREVASCVDDLTLRDGLDRTRAPRDGWFRIVSDDRRLLHLIRRQARADGSLRDALAPTAALFGTDLEEVPGGMLKVVDEIGSPICIGAQLPGERERPCEIVTPPIAPEADFGATLERLLATARRLGFSVPAESATHLHLESAALESAPVLASLVELLATWGDALKAAVRSNPRCVRLGPIPDALLETVRTPGFRELDWPSARARLASLKLSKYVDWNMKNLAHPRADKPTFEVRVLPGTLRAEPVEQAARLFVAIAQRCVHGPPVEPADRAPLGGLLDQLEQGGYLRDAGVWRARA